MERSRKRPFLLSQPQVELWAVPAAEQRPASPVLDAPFEEQRRRVVAPLAVVDVREERVTERVGVLLAWPQKETKHRLVLLEES